MLTITIQDVVNDTLPESGWGKFRIYVLRDDQYVLYVGMTEQNIIDRLEAHLGFSHHAPSHVGRLVEDNEPFSYAWSIDLLSLDECASIVKQQFPTSKHIDVRFAEQALILYHSPPLNKESNPHPHPLPRKYLLRQNTRAQKTHKKVFDDR